MGLRDGIRPDDVNEMIERIANGDAKIANQMRDIDPTADAFREKLNLDHNNPVHALALVTLLAELLVDRCIETKAEHRIEPRIKMLQVGLEMCAKSRLTTLKNMHRNS